MIFSDFVDPENAPLDNEVWLLSILGHFGDFGRLVIRIFFGQIQQRFFNGLPKDFAAYLRSGMSLGALIMTYKRPLLRATYEAILLNITGIWQKLFNFRGNRTQVFRS